MQVAASLAASPLQSVTQPEHFAKPDMNRGSWTRMPAAYASAGAASGRPRMKRPRKAAAGHGAGQAVMQTATVKKRLRVRQEDSVKQQEQDETHQQDSGDDEVEAIVGARGSGAGREYLVKWVGHPFTAATWEPAANCADCVAAFEKLERARTRLWNEQELQMLQQIVAAQV